MQKTMSREGSVIALNGEIATVVIDRKAVCGECKVASTCRSSECKQMYVSAMVQKNIKVDVGQRVLVAVDAHDAMLSVWIGYGVPLCVFVVCCALASFFGASEAMVAGMGLLMVVAYYLALFLFRKRVDRRFVCNIVKVI